MWQYQTRADRSRPEHTIPYHVIPYHTIPYHTIPAVVEQGAHHIQSEGYDVAWFNVLFAHVHHGTVCIVWQRSVKVRQWP